MKKDKNKTEETNYLLFTSIFAHTVDNYRRIGRPISIAILHTYTYIRKHSMLSILYRTYSAPFRYKILLTFKEFFNSKE